MNDDDSDIELRLTALDRAIAFHSYMSDTGYTVDVIATAASIEEYLRGSKGDAQ